MPSSMLDIFDIQRFSWLDGPGIRSVVFLSGCNLRCLWCHNPESQGLKPEVFYYEEHCIRCGKCVEVCPAGCHAITLDGSHRFDRAGCTRCGRCTEVCYSEALQLSGRRVSLESIVREVMEDAEFYEASGGGVTLSGGEPLLQDDGCRALLEELKAFDAGLNTAVDTAGHVPWTSFEKILPFTDYVLYDVKAWSDDLHRRGTGVSNQLILENLHRLSRSSVQLIIRIPIVPGFNDDPEEVKTIADGVSGLANVFKIEILPFHRIGEAKYRALGRGNPTDDLPLLDPDRIDELRAAVGL